MQAWTGIVLGFLGIIGAIFASIQIFQIKKQLQVSTLTNEKWLRE